MTTFFLFSERLARPGLRCEECNCAAQYCDDGNNGTGRCTLPPTPGSAPTPSTGSVPITVFVAAGCGILFIGCIVVYVGRSKQNARNAGRTTTVKEPLLQAPALPIGTGGYRPMSATEERVSLQQQQAAMEDELGGESLEERLARMEREME